MPNPPPRPGHWLDDLESIRELLGDERQAGEPLADDASLDPDAIPLLSEIVEPAPRANDTPAPDASPRSVANRQLEAEIRAAANLILQDVIDDFVPQIESEMKKRLERLLRRSHPDLF